MKVLVLGGSRFIGRAIVDALLPAHQVTVLNRGTQPLPDRRVRQLVADRDAPEQLAGALAGQEYQAVVDVSGLQPRQVTNLLAALPGGAPRYVFISSAAVYNRAEAVPPFAETARADGDAVWGEYGRDKAACEALLRQGVAGELTVLRPPYVYGPRNTEPREQFLWARLLADLPVLVPGDGSIRLQFCHAEDLAAVVVAACEGRLAAGTYNVGEERDHSFAGYLGVLAEVVGARGRLALVGDDSLPARTYFPFRQVDLTLDVTRLAATGRLATRDLADGLAGTYAWFRDHASDQLTYHPTPTERTWREATER